MEDVATADRIAGDHRHHRLWQPADLDLEVEDVQPADAALVDVAVVAPDLLVAAARERPGSLAGQDHDPDRRIVSRHVERPRQLANRERAERVPNLRPGHGDLRDALGRLVPDIGVLAGRDPFHDCALLERSLEPFASLADVRREPSLNLVEHDLVEHDLLAVRLPPGPRWVGVLDEAWERGAAVIPIDSRVAPAAAERLVRLARPTAILSEGGMMRSPDGEPVDDGVALVVATSGTSAEPKLVELERDAIEAAVKGSAEALARSEESRVG